jgi:NarL family two-component system response regulator LiaR
LFENSNANYKNMAYDDSDYVKFNTSMGFVMASEHPPKQNPIRVLIVDDNVITRMGLGIFFDNHDDMVLVGEASNGQDAVDLCRELLPDVVLMDLMMPVMDGMTATAIIRQEFPSIHIIALTSGFGGETEADVLGAGASAYLTKNTSTETLASVIRDVLE